MNECLYMQFVCMKCNNDEIHLYNIYYCMIYHCKYCCKPCCRLKIKSAVNRPSSFFSGRIGSVLLEQIHKVLGRGMYFTSKSGK